MNSKGCQGPGNCSLFGANYPTRKMPLPVPHFAHSGRAITTPDASIKALPDPQIFGRDDVGVPDRQLRVHQVGGCGSYGLAASGLV